MDLRSRTYAHRRRRIGRRFLRGEGIEIGALHRPFPVPRAVRVRYLDRFTTEQLRVEYPELVAEPFAEVEIVDDGETLGGVADASQDFVIASHVLEHAQDPIGALQHHLRVLRPAGVVVLALLDRRTGIAALRAPTSLEHLLADHEQGPRRSRAQHYREWAELVDVPLGYVEADAVAAHAEQLERSQHSIHFHCWTREEFLGQLPGFGLPATVVAARQNLHEFLVVLRKA